DTLGGTIMRPPEHDPVIEVQTVPRAAERQINDICWLDQFALVPVLSNQQLVARKTDNRWLLAVHVEGIKHRRCRRLARGRDISSRFDWLHSTSPRCPSPRKCRTALGRCVRGHLAASPAWLPASPFWPRLS